MHSLLEHEVHVTEPYAVRQLEACQQINDAVYVCRSEATPQKAAVIYSFDQQVLDRVCPLVQQLLSVNQVPLECKPEEAIYLKYFNKAFLKKLPVNVEFKDGDERVMLCGGEAEVRAAEGEIRAMLAGLCSRKFSFTCNAKFKDQIKQTLLAPHEGEEPSFRHFVPTGGSGGQAALRGKGGRRRASQANNEGGGGGGGGGGGNNEKWSLYIFAKNLEFFENLCGSLGRLSPNSRYFHISHKEEEAVISEMKAHLENKYSVSIFLNKNSSYVIHSLYQEEIQKCQDEIKEKVDRTVEVVKYIPVDVKLHSTLRLYQHELDELKRGCKELTVLRPNQDHDNGMIRVRGPVGRVGDVLERLKSGLLAMTVFSEEFDVPCMQWQFGMWCRRWNQVKNLEEKKSKISITFTKSAAAVVLAAALANQSPATDKMLSVHFEVVGTDKESVQEVMSTIMAEGTEVEEKTFSLSASAITSLLKAKRDKKLEFLSTLTVFIRDVNRQGNTVTLCAPKELSDDLETAEEKIKKFAGDRASTIVVLTSQDPVVGLILGSPARSQPYVTLAITLAKTHGASVHVLKKPSVGLRVSGTEKAVAAVKPLLQAQVIGAIERTIGHRAMQVKPLYGPFLSTSDFSRFQSKLEVELQVVCSLPKTGKASKLLATSLLQLPPARVRLISPSRRVQGGSGAGASRCHCQCSKRGPEAHWGAGQGRFGTPVASRCRSSAMAMSRRMVR